MHGQRDTSPPAFWERLSGRASGLEIAVASSSSDQLLGVRDGFLRYFRDSLGRSLSLALVPHAEHEHDGSLPLSDAEAVSVARRESRDLADALGEEYHFYVGSEGGIRAIDVDGTVRHFVTSWTVVSCPFGEAIGNSGSILLPPRLVEGLEDDEVATAIPGTRRRGGLISSLTGGLESRRTAVADATFFALSSLFFGVFGSGRATNR